MARSMNDDQQRVVRYASVKGSYAPPTKKWFDVVLKLVRDGVLEEADNHPGAFALTAAGQRIADELVDVVA